ncbi:MAG: RNA polymerase sigma factor FliA [Myxococcota bacterium]|jgi:RNA polymerase sigma factor for flagellar operon FliA|nr:RNA polymerase sigma factor FliA [Myxococcota bacterium]
MMKNDPSRIKAAYGAASTVLLDEPRPQSPITDEERNRLTREFLPIVEKIARGVARKAPSTVSIDDLIGAGTLGLVDAASRFDPSRGDQFRSFVESRVRGAMIDEIRAHGPMTRELRTKSNLVSEAIRALERDHGRQPTDEEIAARLALSLEKYHDMLLHLQHQTVLSADLIEQMMDRPRGYPERVPGNPHDDLVFSELRDRLAEGIAKLSPKEQRVLSWYYKDDVSLKEIGERLGVTESRACQVRTEAVHRLRALILGEE